MKRKENKLKTIQQYEADKIRTNPNGFLQYQVNDSCDVSQEIIATGRAICRCCGTKINKGEPAIQFLYDFHGNGSNTLTLSQIHKNNCKEATK